MNRNRFGETLAALVRNEVEFIVVGMAAGVLQGAPLTTADIDIVHRRTPENVARLLTALGEMKAVYRGDPRRLAPAESHPVLDLATLIDVKRRAGRPKDLAVVPVLEAALDETRRNS